jgi:DegV family protein with EDD domain
MLTILTDSCADLSQPILDEYQLETIPLHVLVDNKDYFDNELSIFDLFASVEQTGETPKTAAPSVQEFLEFFDREGPTLYIGLSSQLSATLQNAQLAEAQLQKDDLFIIDSQNLSTGIGLLVLKAFDLMQNGKTAQNILEILESDRQYVKTSFVIDTMDYLYRGGRCTALQAFVGSMLKIHPVIYVKPDGSLGVLDKVRGNRQKALNSLLMNFKRDLPNVDLTRVFVTHSGCDGDAEYLVKELRKLAPIEEIHTTIAGATIASHCGPNTIGILYMTNN